MAKNWTPKEVVKLYRIEKTKTSLYRDELSGLIPKAQRVKRGKTEIRIWEHKDLPEIGRHHGFLTPPEDTKVISVYTPKGGVLKSTVALNLARMLALNGINTLVIGLDVQCTVTHNLSKDEEITNVDDIKEVFGLYESAKSKAEGGCSIEDAIHETDLPTLFYIPESSNLNLLEQRIRDENRREFVIERLIKPLKNKFQVVIFDNSPNWNFLIQNSLAAATDVICPIACDIETFRSLMQNIEMINDFKAKMELSWSNFILIPTKVERTKLSTQIEAQYRTLFPELITASSIRVAAKGQESSLEKLSVIEYDAASQLADDYYGIVQDIWNRINPEKSKIKTKPKSSNHEIIEAMEA
ncbi:MAG: ParA family protein [Legionella sp.]|nr:ParA family protein [Legionella sp.]